TPSKYVVTARTKLTSISAFRLDVLPDPSLPAMGPGRAPNGNFVLSEFQVRVAGEGEAVKSVILSKAAATFAQEGFGPQGAIDGNAATGWAIAPQFGKAHTA